MMDMYIDEEEKSRKKQLLRMAKTAGAVLWVVMIGVLVFLTSRSLVVIN